MNCPRPPQIHLLRAERQLVHPLSRASEDDVHDRAVFRLHQPLIGVLDATMFQDVGHAFGNALTRVYGAYFTTGSNLEVQLFARRIVVAFFMAYFSAFSLRLR